MVLRADRRHALRGNGPVRTWDMRRGDKFCRYADAHVPIAKVVTVGVVSRRRRSTGDSVACREERLGAPTDQINSQETSAIRNPMPRQPTKFLS
jgi:hypothetical protein